MALTNRQIERYSRQLIVADFGGVAQERLLATRLLLVDEHADTDSVLAYLVGAGVGRIDLCADFEPDATGAIVARMRDLNPDSTVRIQTRGAFESGDFAGLDLALVIVDDAGALDRARALFDRLACLGSNAAIILARLDQPARVAVLPRRPPCPRCASVGGLLAPTRAQAENAGFIRMFAALEAIKLLARHDPAPVPTLIEFRGYESSARVIDSVPGSSCACTTAEAVSRTSDPPVNHD